MNIEPLTNGSESAELSGLKLYVFLGLSLDGCIAGEQGDLSWMEVCAAESPGDTGYDALMAQVDTLLLGRRTYDAVMGFGAWPFVGKRVRVLTHRSLEPRHGECAMGGPLREVLAQLAAEGARHIYIDGGDVVRQALVQDLVHEMTLSWVPVVLGRGTRLFETGLPGSAWQLAGSRQFRSGMVQARYCRVPRQAS